jgi:hypothetical protein
MGGDPRLRYADRDHQLADGQLAVVAERRQQA